MRKVSFLTSANFNRSDGPQLSILIPTYNYLEGVCRILDSLTHCLNYNIEIIISDDSSDENIERIVMTRLHQFNEKLRYIRQKPSLGAVKNWNYLLESAKGEYILLLHHDEYPLDLNFIEKLIYLIDSKNEIDVFVLPCMIAESGKPLREHLPNSVRKTITEHFPLYLFRRNVVGPTSSIVARRQFYPRFDENLKWLVDVDLYYRLRHLTDFWSFQGPRIASLINRPGSITSVLADDILNLNIKELKYIKYKYRNVDNKLILSDIKLIIFIEQIFWTLIRLSCRITSRVKFLISNSKF
jgi:glycosyltransferase involved in cell wall biosynthesis